MTTKYSARDMVLAAKALGYMPENYPHKTVFFPAAMRQEIEQWIDRRAELNDLLDHLTTTNPTNT